MEDRDAKLQDYIRRLGEGEDLESVRKDFVENFKDVDASEIMKAEQDLMKSGMPYQQVQKLCDVHSALFHGATKQERIANAEKAVRERGEGGVAVPGGTGTAGECRRHCRKRQRYAQEGREQGQHARPHCGTPRQHLREGEPRDRRKDQRDPGGARRFLALL